ncbi:DNA replication initiation factor cdc45 [Sporothrix stenoceras]|uniref:DNA replication initiation factor cdc45 n=1 Tax=Sporothrix stenoceras TaxID=5173 RepID=A0ABR3ZJX5_9PEZI
MYLPRSLVSKLYLHLQNSRHPLAPPVLILVALEPDALCACRILTSLLKHDYIPHKIQPVAGYADLARVGRELVAPMMQTRGGNGGVVVCLGVGGTVDLATFFGLESEEDDIASGELAFGGVEVWVLDAHRPWNLSNVFGGFPLEPAGDSQSLSVTATPTLSGRVPPGVRSGQIERAYKPGKGGLIVFDDGDIEDDLVAERDAYMALADMPEIDDDGRDDLGESSEEEHEDDEEGEEDEEDGERPPPPRAGQKRKSWLDDDEEEAEDDSDDDRPRQRRRSNSSSPIPGEARPKSRPLLSLRGRDQPSSDALAFSDESRNDEDGAPGSSKLREQKKAPSARTLRRRLLRLKHDNETILRKYYRMGASYSEPISSMMYSLASELGREDNDLLWLTIVGVTSMELYGRSSAGVGVSIRSGESRPTTGWMGMRGARIRQLLRDEVRRLNPPDSTPLALPGVPGSGGRPSTDLGIIPTTARSPEDTSIRLSPEPKFLLIRHWSLYDSMLHSPYLFSRLKMWSETGLKRLHKLFAKMGVSLVQCKQSYSHMDMMLKRELRVKLLKYASLYNLDGMVPTIDTDGKDRAGAKDGWGFVRSWGWRATLSAQDVAVVIGALLEVGKNQDAVPVPSGNGSSGNNNSNTDDDAADEEGDPSEEWVPRFWEAYDALESIEFLKDGLRTAKFLHRAIFNTGTALIKKKQITHLHAFRMCIVKDGPDAAVFNHPGALTKLALWIGEALAEQEKDANGRLAHGGRGTPLVVASLNEKRGVYVVVGTGGGGGPDMLAQNRSAALKKHEARAAKAKLREDKRAAKKVQREEAKERRRTERAKEGKDGEEEDEEEEGDDDEDDSDSDSDSESDDDDDIETSAENSRGFGLNRFGTAFQDVVAETNTRVRIDSFEHCVVEVKKEDLGGFLESLSMKAVVG